MSTHRALRATFDEVAELYDRARPSYPPQLFDDLTELAALRPGARVLEIGCGTGQATVPLAERGLDIVCVELGERLAAIARGKLAHFPHVRVVNAPFETWDGGAAPFDAVVAFTAFRWLDRRVRSSKAAELLRPRRHLAVVATQHVLPEGGDRFFLEVQDDYDAIAPGPDNRPPPRPQAVDDLGEEIDTSGLFEHVAARRYLWDVSYSADEYLAMLDTYSGHRALGEERRRRLYERIRRRRIEARPHGAVTKTYLAMLNVARRR